MDSDSLMQLGQTFIYGPREILINMAVSIVMGLIISWVYRSTHKGLSYSQSFVLTLVFVSIIVASVMMIIGNSLARAFALVGALSIIRFRTVVKDTKDVAFVFFALAAGMAAGTSNYFLAATVTIVMSTVALVLHRINYGAMYKSEFILRFQYDREAGGEDEYTDTIQQYSKLANLLHVESSGDGRYITITYDIVLKDDGASDDFAAVIDTVAGVSAVTLIASKNDVDF
ncbi:DUF4956 domain-containing protein [Nitrospirota bacterium]